MLTEDEKLQAEKQKKDVSFGRFMEAAQTKFMLGLLPPTDKAPPETLETLLRLSFDAGEAHGMGTVVTQMLSALTKPKKE